MIAKCIIYDGLGDISGQAFLPITKICKSATLHQMKSANAFLMPAVLCASSEFFPLAYSKLQTHRWEGRDGGGSSSPTDAGEYVWRYRNLNGWQCLQEDTMRAFSAISQISVDFAWVYKIQCGGKYEIWIRKIKFKSLLLPQSRMNH